VTPIDCGTAGGAERACQRPVLVLVGQDGNAYSILGRARQALRLAGRGDEWGAFAAEATSSDYDHLLATVTDWFDVR
jgi:hypothetical protein